MKIFLAPFVREVLAVLTLYLEVLFPLFHVVPLIGCFVYFDRR